MKKNDLYSQPHIQATLKLEGQIMLLCKDRDALRKQRDGLDLNIESATLNRLPAVVLDLTAERKEVHEHWWSVVQSIDTLRQEQNRLLKTTKAL